MANPHFHLDRMKAVAHSTTASTQAELCALFQPSVNDLSHEEWQLLIQYACNTLLAPEEWRFFELCNIFIKREDVLPADVERVRSWQNRVFAENPASANFVSFDAARRGMSRQQLLRDLVQVLLCRLMAKEGQARLEMALAKADSNKRNSVVMALAELQAPGGVVANMSDATQQSNDVKRTDSIVAVDS